MAGGGMFSFDLGNQFAGMGGEGAGGTEECGSRPSCLFGKNCKDKRDQYNACVNKAMELKKEVAIHQIDANARSNAKKSKGFQLNTKTILIGVGVLVVLFLLFRK